MISNDRQWWEDPNAPLLCGGAFGYMVFLVIGVALLITGVGYIAGSIFIALGAIGAGTLARGIVRLVRHYANAQ